VWSEEERKKTDDTRKEKEITQHLEAVAKILYRQAKPEQVKTLDQIEAKVREQTLEYITPQLGFFLSSTVPKHKQGWLGFKKTKS
jgi:hypothetical protein